MIGVKQFNLLLRSCVVEGMNTINEDTLKDAVMKDKILGHDSFNWTSWNSFIYQDFFYSGDESKSFHTERLLLVGVLLCSGNLYERAEVLCRIASKGDQNFVKNRDFWPIFLELVHICINLTVDQAKDIKRAEEI